MTGAVAQKVMVNQELKLQRKMGITQEPEMVVTRNGSEFNSLMT